MSAWTPEQEEARDRKADERRRARNAQVLRLLREGMPETQARLIAIADHPEPLEAPQPPQPQPLKPPPQPQLPRPPAPRAAVATGITNGAPPQRGRPVKIGSLRRPGPRPEAPTYIGVVWDRCQGYWIPNIYIEGKSKKLGYFGADDHEAAARCRDQGLIEAWGLERAAPRLNFPAEHPGALEAIARATANLGRPPNRRPRAELAPISPATHERAPEPEPAPEPTWPSLPTPTPSDDDLAALVRELDAVRAVLTILAPFPRAARRAILELILNRLRSKTDANPA